ncbi:uncharacterized protein G2W53_039628 [Senna tora]|uniref:Uncharacterized protein n=1 Tax=Senna tora TaxID=362788 RepID=A0A834STN1_9FABA|nr:uncharacterized protein G2W53_039628 [Senna tora]
MVSDLLLTENADIFAWTPLVDTVAEKLHYIILQLWVQADSDFGSPGWVPFHQSYCLHLSLGPLCLCFRCGASDRPLDGSDHHAYDPLGLSLRSVFSSPSIASRVPSSLAPLDCCTSSNAMYLVDLANSSAIVAGGFLVMEQQNSLLRKLSVSFGIATSIILSVNGYLFFFFRGGVNSVDSEEEPDPPAPDFDELLSDSSFCVRRLLDLLFSVLRDLDFRF